MEVRSESTQARSDNKLPPPAAPKPRVQVWFVTVCSTILIWTCLVQLFAAGELWRTRIFTGQVSRFSAPDKPVPLPPPLPPPSLFLVLLPFSLLYRLSSECFDNEIIVKWQGTIQAMGFYLYRVTADLIRCDLLLVTCSFDLSDLMF